MNIKKKIRLFFFPDIWRSLSVSLRYALGRGAMQKIRPFSRIASRFPAVNADRCTGCKLCAKVCPAKAIEVKTVFQGQTSPAVTFLLSENKCVSCGLCTEACPEDALTLKGK